MRSRLDRILERLEPETIPSQRYNRIVPVDAVDVLELRDPNSGQDPDPASKPRHQYVRHGVVVWRRVLPPESVGDAWIDTGAPRWETVDAPSGLLAELAPHLPEVLRVAVLRRLRMQDGYGDAIYIVRGAPVPAEEIGDVGIAAGPITGAWWEVMLPACLDCDGDVVWYEAGYVPGARRCVSCGSMYTVESEGM